MAEDSEFKRIMEKIVRSIVGGRRSPVGKGSTDQFTDDDSPARDPLLNLEKKNVERRKRMKASSSAKFAREAELRKKRKKRKSSKVSKIDLMKYGG